MALSVTELASWYEKSHARELSGIAYEDWKLLRRKCQTDLWFLARDIFKKDLVEVPHRAVCSFFIQKNPDKPIEEQDNVKDRLLLLPRGAFKSTLNIIDSVQWIICFCNIRIMIVTAARDLAEAFVSELKNYFIVRDPDKPTEFQQLFPEFCVPAGDAGPSRKWTTPARTVFSKEPTVWAASLLENLPGWHCNVQKPDDAVNEKNTATAALVQKGIDNFDRAHFLVDPGGYRDGVGTPYAIGDVYAHWQTTSNPGELKILRMPAWTPKLGKERIRNEDLTEEDVELLFPADATGKPRLTYQVIRAKLRKNPAICNSQYFLNPSGTQIVKFPQELLESCTIDWKQVPQKLIHYIVWDFAYSQGKKKDYSVGVVGALDEENRLYVLDIFRDRYIDSDLAFKIAESCKTYRPVLIPIENSNGAQFLSSAIHRFAEELGIETIPLDFFTVDTRGGAKMARIGALEPLMKRGQLFFLNTISCLEALYLEFQMLGSTSHDDIPDCISFLQRVLPTYSNITPQSEANKELVKRLQERDFYDLLFQEGNYAPPVPQAPIEPESPPGEGVIDYFHLG